MRFTIAPQSELDCGCGARGGQPCQRTGFLGRSKPCADRPGPYVPLSVRHGGWRKKFAWWLKGQRERVALRLAPWLKGPS